jgi:muramoyltetrapeptide carboxypeptidase
VTRRLPPVLRRGDAIGVISASAPAAGLYPRRFERGLAELRRLGFDPRPAPNATAIDEPRGRAGTAAARAEDFHTVLADPEVTGIINAVGGHAALEMVEHVDWDLVAHNPKVILGYSDFTVVLAGVWTAASVGGIYGPALLPQFGEPGGLHPFTERSLRAAVCTPHPAGELLASGCVIVASARWDEDDDAPRPSAPAPRWRLLRPGSTRGPLIAANLNALARLIGTPWFPDCSGAVLFLEASHTTRPSEVAALLAQLRHGGVFRACAAVVLGRFHPRSGCDSEIVDTLVEDLVDVDGPALADADFGHTDPMLSLPWGAHTVVDGCRVEIIESAVR